MSKIATRAQTLPLVIAAIMASAAAPAVAGTVSSPLTIDAWRDVVEQQIDRTLTMPQADFRVADHAVTAVRIHFDAAGTVDGTAIATSSGNGTLDKEALRTARVIDYPALPEGLRGRPQSVLMQIYFASAPGEQHERAIRAMSLAARGIGPANGMASAER